MRFLARINIPSRKFVQSGLLDSLWYGTLTISSILEPFVIVSSHWYSSVNLASKW